MSALPAISISAGQHLLLCRDSTGLSNYFDGDLEQFPGAMHPTLFYESGFPSANGNDAFILKNSGSDKHQTLIILVLLQTVIGHLFLLQFKHLMELLVKLLNHLQ